MKLNRTLALEIKSLKSREFEGHGAIFRNVDLGGDIVVPGAFQKSLNRHKKSASLPQMFWMHDPSRIPGKWLDMYEDDSGLVVKGVLADTELGNEIHTLLKMDAVRGLSIGYQVDRASKNSVDFDDDGNRLIKEAHLYEVSVVSLPMNPLAQVAHVKSRLSADGAYVPTAREFELQFRRMGCSKQVSRRLVSMILESAGETLADDEEETGGTLVESVEPSRCDADEEKQAAEALAQLNEEMLAGLIKRQIA